MKSGIDVLSQYESRKIAVLADMLELGEYEERLHREVGKYLIEKKIDMLVCVGNATKYIYDETKDSMISYHFDSNQEVEEFLLKVLKENDIVLMKGSNSMKLKEVVDYIKENVK